ncbi:hypothetical protein LINPERPRIM_LOCUS30375, partial [Linum perenne]
HWSWSSCNRFIKQTLFFDSEFDCPLRSPAISGLDLVGLQAHCSLSRRVSTLCHRRKAHCSLSRRVSTLCHRRKAHCSFGR